MMNITKLIRILNVLSLLKLEKRLNQILYCNNDISVTSATLKQHVSLSQTGGFSASLVTSGELTLRPYNTFTPLVFRHVVTNTGNAFSPNAGT